MKEDREGAIKRRGGERETEETGSLRRISSRRMDAAEAEGWREKDEGSRIATGDGRRERRKGRKLLELIERKGKRPLRPRRCLLWRGGRGRDVNR